MDVKLIKEKIKKAEKEIEAHKEKIKILNDKIKSFEVQIEEERQKEMQNIISKRFKNLDDAALKQLDKILNGSGNFNQEEKI